MGTATLTPANPARRRRPQDGASGELPRLFGDEPLAVATPAVVPASAPAATLADRVSDVWSTLTAAAGSVPCLVCGAELQPRWSAGSGVVGGRCDGCGTTLE